MKPDAFSNVDRRDFLKLAGAATACRVSHRAFAAPSERCTLILDPANAAASSGPAKRAAGQLRHALAAKGVTCEIASSSDSAAGASFCIVVSGPESQLARGFPKGAALTAAESLRLSSGKVGRTPALLVSGGDARGYVYGLLELADRVRNGSSPVEALRLTDVVEEKPANDVRCVSRYFCSELEDKSWYYDKAFWTGYLDSIAANRFNRFTMAYGLEYDFPRGVTDDYLHLPYPYLVDVPGYPDVRVMQLAAPDGTRLPTPLPVSKAERDRNFQMLRFIAAETGARGLHFQLGIWTHAYHWTDSPKGTGGSGGTFGFFDSQERRDMHDLVEWAAQQPWSDGNVGMIGISYFAGTQMEAAVERPPHLKAIMPIAGTFDLYESGTHHGLMSSGFITPFLYMIGMTSGHTNKLWRSKLMDAMRAFLLTPGIHKKFEMANGEAAIAGLKVLLKLHHDPHPWDDLWRSIAAEHPFRDAWWEDRNLLPLLDRVEVPVYLGCDWQNVPLYLPHTFTAYERLSNCKHLQVAMMGEHGLAWPWESLDIEALAWFDHWLKGQDTGILDGPNVRHVIPEAAVWRTSDTWPVREVIHRSYALRADGALGEDEGEFGSRTYMNLGGGLNRPRASETDPPSILEWTTPPLAHDVDVIGPIELQLDAACTAPDTAFIAFLQDVYYDGHATNITAGYLRAGLRKVDEEQSKVAVPVLPCNAFEAVPIGRKLTYRIPLVPNARRFKAGHKMRLYLTADDQNKDIPAPLEFRHASIGTSSFNTVFSSSRLLLPVAN